MWGIELSVMLAMIAINGLLAGYEIALASASLARLRVLAGENRPGARAALQMKQNMEGSLAMIQLGITLVGATAAATGGAGAAERVAPALATSLGLSWGVAEVLAIAMVVVPLTTVTILLGELVPKVFALRHKEWVCLRLSPGMRWLAVSVWPAVWLLDTLVRFVMHWGEHRWQQRLNAPLKSEAAELQELRALASLARTLSLIGTREENIILGAARLSSRPVREIMLRAEHIVMLNIGESLANSLVAAHLDMHTRFPVTERLADPQSIIGYVNFKDIVAQMHLSPQEPSLRAILRPIASLPDDLPIASCLERLIRGHTHIALIRDTSDRVAGMITLEDIIEELVGEIEDEYDRLPAYGVPTGSGWVVGGGATLAQLKEWTGIELPPGSTGPGVGNVSALVTAYLGRSPRGGDVIERDGLRILVRKVRRQKMLEAQISREPAPLPNSGTPSSAVPIR